MNVSVLPSTDHSEHLLRLLHLQNVIKKAAVITFQGCKIPFLGITHLSYKSLNTLFCYSNWTSWIISQFLTGTFNTDAALALFEPRRN